MQRPPSGLSVATHPKDPCAPHFSLKHSLSNACPLCYPPLRVLCLGGAALDQLFCPLLCSGESDSCYQERFFIHHVSPYTHNDPVAPRLSSRPALTLCDQQTRWRKEADSVARPPFAFHATYAPQDGSFSPLPSHHLVDSNTVTWFILFCLFTHSMHMRRK